MHTSISRTRFLSLCAVIWLSASVIATAVARAQQTTDRVQAHWQLQEIRFTYTGFTTAYACDSLEGKVRDILVTLGAHPSTKVSATGCVGSHPSRTAFVRIATATPEPVALDGKASIDRLAENRAQLLERMNLEDDFGSRSFVARWETFQLAENRELDLAPGDCELMAQLRDQVLPELGVRILQESISCIPHQLSIMTPPLQVSALVPAKSSQADASG